MLVFDKIVKPKGIYNDYSKDLLNQINSVKMPRTPLSSYNVKKYPIIKHNFDYGFKEKSYKIKHINQDFGDDVLKHGIVKPDTQIDLEKDFLKPILGVPDKDIPDGENQAHYQFRLQGKTDADVALSNLSQEQTSLDNLKENAKTGESLMDIQKFNEKSTDLPTARAKFVKMFKERIQNKETTAKDATQDFKKAMKNKIAIEPIISQRKSIRLQPVANRKVADAPILPKATKVSVANTKSPPPPAVRLGLISRFYLYRCGVINGWGSM
jgi:hypothetical protein